MGNLDAENGVGTVLIVDDEPQLARMIEAILSDHGLQCIRTSHAPDALDLIRERDVDVVVSDVRMPGMDGIQFLRAARERFQDRTWLQVLFVTGHGTMDTAIEALRWDAVDFLHKPVRRLELIEAVDRALAKSKTLRKAANVWAEGQTRLSRLSEEVRRIAHLLELPGPEQIGSAPASTPTPTKEPAPAPAPEVDEKTRLLQIIRTIGLRSKHFKGELFADPVWQMLLFLMESRLQERKVFLTSLYLASGVPVATAARRFDELENAGFVVHWRDPADKRRQVADLTPAAAERVANYLKLMDRGWQN